MPNKMQHFTKRARRALSFAQEEAERMQRSAVGTEHLLVGLMREGIGIAAQSLHNLGLDSVHVADLAEQITTTAKRAENASLELNADTKKAIVMAVDEANRMGDHVIGTEHLLLGMMRQSEITAVDILNRLNVTPEDVRRQVRRLLQEQQTPGINPVSQASAATSTPSAPADWRVWLTLAEVEALGLNHSYIGTGHLLLALLSKPQPQTFEALPSLENEKENVSRILKDMPAEHASAQKMAFSSQLVTSLGLAAEEAYRSAKRVALRAEFLMLGLVRNRQSAAAQILERLHISLAEEEAAIRKLLSDS